MALALDLATSLVPIGTPSSMVSLLAHLFFLVFLPWSTVYMLIGSIDTHSAADPAGTGMGSRGSRSEPNTSGSTAMGGDGSTRARAGSSDMHSGPHDSKLANKMDPRVDSDMGKPS